MTIFYGTGDKQPLLLGSLGLQQIGCQIDMKQQEWCFSIQPLELKVISTSQMTRLIQEQQNGQNPHVFVIYCQARDYARETLAPQFKICRIAQADHTNNEMVSGTLPTEFKEYQDVSTIPDVPTLVKGVEHEIKTTKDRPFGPIYNLSSKELEMLRAHLQTPLEQRRI